MALDKNDIDILSEAFKRAMKSDPGYNSRPSGPAPVSGSKPSGEIGNAIDGLTGEILGLGKAAAGTAVEGFGALMKGGVTVSDALNITASNFKSSGSTVGGIFGKITGIGGDLVHNLEVSMDMYKSLSVSGASFNSSLVDLRMASAGTRMTLNDFGALIEKNTASFALLPGGVEKGALLFADASQKMFDDSGLIERMTRMGYTTNDLNSLLSYTIVQQKRRGLSDEEATAKAIEQAENLAFEMDAVAKLTGKSRKEQEAALRKAAEDGQLRAATELAVRNGGKDVKAAFDSMKVAADIGGPEFAKLQEQMFAMGRPTKDMAGAFAQAGGEAQRLMKASADAARRGDEQMAKRLTLEAAAAYAQQQQSEAQLILAREGNAVAIKGNASTAALADQMKATAKEMGVDLKSAEGRRAVLEKISADTAKKQQGAADATTRTLNTVTNNMNDYAAGVQQGTFKQLKQGEMLDKALDDYYKTLDSAKGKENKLREQSSELADKGFKKILALVSGQDPKASAMTAAIEKGLAMSKEKGTGLTAQSPEMKGLLSMLTTEKGTSALQATMDKAAKKEKMDPNEYLAKVLAQGRTATDQLVMAALAESRRQVAEEERKAKLTPGQSRLEDVQNRRKARDAEAAEGSAGSDPISRLVGLATTASGLNVNVLKMPGVPEKRTGSLGTTGNLFEDFGTGTLAMLHGKESVITEDQMSNLAKGISKMNMSEIAAKSNTTAPKSETKPTQITSSATLNDVVDSLQSLNRLMAQMISSTDSMVDNSQRQIKATKGLNGNIYSR
jgi:hypothetical protein